jgi:hypothetical protein
MKGSKVFEGAFVAFAMFMATSAFGANKGPMHVMSAVDVAGTELAAGDYTVQWEGAGVSVELKIMKGKKLIATASAKLVTLERPSTSDAIFVNNNDGVRRLWQIHFSGKTLALEIVGVSGTIQHWFEWQRSASALRLCGAAPDPRLRKKLWAWWSRTPGDSSLRGTDPLDENTPSSCPAGPPVPRLDVLPVGREQAL